MTARSDTERAKAAQLAARSGGAQDDGLRARVEHVLSIWDDQHSNCGCKPRSLIRDLRRALAGPDDTQQDGAR